MNEAPLLTLITKQQSIDCGCKVQSLIRKARAEAAGRGKVTEHKERVARFEHGPLPRAAHRALASRAPAGLDGSATSIPRGEPFADDWAPCPTCGFILVACDCDANIQREREHAA